VFVLPVNLLFEEIRPQSLVNTYASFLKSIDNPAPEFKVEVKMLVVKRSLKSVTLSVASTAYPELEADCVIKEIVLIFSTACFNQV
jgi:hypothetical protein